MFDNKYKVLLLTNNEKDFVLAPLPYASVGWASARVLGGATGTNKTGN